MSYGSSPDARQKYTRNCAHSLLKVCPSLSSPAFSRPRSFCPSFSGRAFSASPARAHCAHWLRQPWSLRRHCVRQRYRSTPTDPVGVAWPPELREKNQVTYRSSVRFCYFAEYLYTVRLTDKNIQPRLTRKINLVVFMADLNDGNSVNNRYRRILGVAATCRLLSGL